ncbi:hypothetical protein PLESTB_001415500 [Pleodorina starrii]|uniref:Uncharacterized protein n=1 Tax=Pleodorina starrii TaxID=330485 RepID=A0A9W6F735_9CHLO|nr:hypothetical protein PLESTB_001415500 [Pleodorina starrii]
MGAAEVSAVVVREVVGVEAAAPSSTPSEEPAVPGGIHRLPWAAVALQGTRPVATALVAVPVLVECRDQSMVGTWVVKLAQEALQRARAPGWAPGGLQAVAAPAGCRGWAVTLGKMAAAAAWCLVVGAGQVTAVAALVLVMEVAAGLSFVAAVRSTAAAVRLTAAAAVRLTAAAIQSTAAAAVRLTVAAVRLTVAPVMVVWVAAAAAVAGWAAAAAVAGWAAAAVVGHFGLAAGVAG